MNYIETKNTSNTIVSLADVQQYLKSSDTSITAFLTNSISFVQKQFESYCQKTLVSTSITGHYDGNGTSKLYLPNYPIISVSSLQYRTDPTSTSWTNFGTYFVYNDFIQLYNEIFYQNYQSIKAVYTAGYTTIPADLKKIAIEGVAEIYKESGQGNSRLGINSTNVSEGNSYGEQYNKLWESHKLILDFYKKVII